MAFPKDAANGPAAPTDTKAPTKAKAGKAATAKVKGTKKTPATTRVRRHPKDLIASMVTKRDKYLGQAQKMDEKIAKAEVTYSNRLALSDLEAKPAEELEAEMAQVKADEAAAKDRKRQLKMALKGKAPVTA